MRHCLRLVIIRRHNSKLAARVTSDSPEVFEAKLRQARGWKGARVFNSAPVNLSNGEAKLVSRIFELSTNDSDLDFETFKKLLAKFGFAGFTMLPPDESKGRQSRK